MKNDLRVESLSISDRIERSRGETGGIAIWYLGQSGFLLQYGGTSIAIDPYLSYSVDHLSSDGFWKRAYRPPVLPEKLRGVDLVLCTHDHLDHTDPETLRGIARASPDCQFAGPRASINRLHHEGIAENKRTTLQEARAFQFRDVLIEPISAAHEKHEKDADGFDLYLGYLLHWNGLTLFHAGDTVVTPRLSARLARENIDVAFLPINGRNDERRKLNIVGNMDASEAVWFAVEHKFGLVVPVHYDLYANNGASLADFTAALEKKAVVDRPRFKAFSPGERLVYGKLGPERSLAVIIGAGQTGRGFLARLLGRSAHEVVFIDVSEALVQRLNEDGSYAVHFFGGTRPPWHAIGVGAALSGSEQAIDWMSRAEVVFIAVGESNVAGLTIDLTRALDRRKTNGAGPLHVFVCENGASPATPLREALQKRSGEVEIAETAIFCSTIELPGTRLDVQSEAYDQLPYDVARAGEFVPLPGMTAVADFPNLLRRKIYTYNCYSACIAYLGAYKGYVWYAEAAQDREIGTIIDRIAVPLNYAIAQTFGVSLEEQKAFSDAALRKFRDASISDDIARNARNVARKLGPNDRLLEPYRLISKNGGETNALALTIAAALLYRGPEEAGLQEMLGRRPVQEVFEDISGCDPQSEISRSVAFYYRPLEDERGKGTPLLEIFSRRPSGRNGKTSS
jgi:mannitol-1-phosphate 5-dehydrogenase